MTFGDVTQASRQPDVPRGTKARDYPRIGAILTQTDAKSAIINNILSQISFFKRMIAPRNIFTAWIIALVISSTAIQGSAKTRQTPGKTKQYKTSIGCRLGKESVSTPYIQLRRRITKKYTPLTNTAYIQKTITPQLKLETGVTYGVIQSSFYNNYNSKTNPYQVAIPVTMQYFLPSRSM